jgi:hypothetical protein
MAAEWSDSRLCDDPCGGVFLSGAVGELFAAASASPEARDPVYLPPDAYTAHAEVGWTLTTSAFYTLLAIAGFALGWFAARTATRRFAPAAGAVAIALVAVVPSAECVAPSPHDPGTNPIAMLGLFLPLSASATGLGALLRRRWIAGAVTLTLGVGLALVLVLVVAGKDCAFS